MKITLEEALRSYHAEASSRGSSAGYVRVCFVYLGKFQRACEAVARDNGRRDIPNLPVSAITPDCVTRYFADLDGRTQATRNRALTSLRKFLEFLEVREYIKPGKAAKLLTGRKIKTAVRRPKHYIPVGRFEDVLNLSGERHPADRMVMALALYTLARQGEIAALRLKDVDLVNGVIRIYRSKRARWTEVTICPDLMGELDKWLAFYAHETGSLGPYMMMSDHPDWYLVPHLNCVRNEGVYKTSLFTYELDPLSKATKLENIVKRCLDGTGADTEHGKYVRHLGEGMHTVRRSGARAMLDYLASEIGNDKALLQVSIMLDHEDPRMTLLYIGRDIERDRLNDYLRTGSMYGPRRGMTGQLGNVIQLRQGA